MRATDATTTETREIISIIEAENRPRSLPAYVARLVQTGDLAALLIRVRSGDRPAVSATPGPPRYADLIARQPCPHGMPGGDQPRPGAGTPACPQCRHSTAQAGAPPTGPRGMADLAEGLAEIAQIKP
ncbi:hypothetical protein [Streptosporangium jomthongense]|uniref:Uncharacterized protein n=1 Tax=Streptosporangium jomthongense TaxID=1193683 RepID=A0ABV8EWS3_9ACTN